MLGHRYPDGARVVFVGDSLTAQNRYSALVTAYYAKHFPDAGIRMWNCGVAGGTAASQLTYLADDTLIHDPTHAVVMVGVNDSCRWLLGEERSPKRYAALQSAYQAYCRNLAALCEAIVSRGIDLTLCTPAPYAEYQKTTEPPFAGGYALMAGYADYVRRLAAEKGYDLCDWHEGLTEVLQSEDVYGPDHIHPTERGHYFMAKMLLEGQGLPLDMEITPPSYDEWKTVVNRIRNVYACELMVIHDYTMPEQEKRTLVEQYLAEKKYPTPYFKSIAEGFLADKPILPSLYAEVDRLMEAF